MNSIRKKYLLVGIVLFVLFMTGCGVTQFTDKNDVQVMLPIASGVYGEGGNWDFLVYPMAWLMFNISKLVGHNYAITILIATILVRSIAWPIYGKTNDMQLKMSLLGPEQRKIEEKYEGKTDQESLQRKNMEVMQLYKKYKVSFSGCFMPFIQMPIFLAFYETLRRIPHTSKSYIESFVGGATFTNGENVITVTSNQLLYDADTLNTNAFGLDLLKTASEGEGWQKIGVYVLAVLVALTQIGTQLLSQRRSKLQREKMESNVPEYRRKGPSDQQKQTEMMMKVTLWSMPIMMAVFIINNSAALGWYWLVGNLYTALQSFISAKTGEKKLAKLREKFNTQNNYY